MKTRFYFFSIFILLISSSANTQSLFESELRSDIPKSYSLGGFTRAGLYLNDLYDNPSLSSGFSDFALQLTAENPGSYKAYADIRLRYGLEFGEPATILSVREAYVSWHNRWIELTAGQQIVKWSRSDFFPVQNLMNPRNDLYLTFEDSDRDLGNIMLGLSIYATNKLSFEMLYLPFKKASFLSTEIMDLPDFIKIKKLPELVSDNHGGSWAFKMGLGLRNLDIGLSYYRGFNPMPMICYDTLVIYRNEGDPPTELLLNSEFYNVSMFSSNFELVSGRIIFRGELSYLETDRSSPLSTYIPFSEILWAVGLEQSSGNLRILMEYQGKNIIDFTETESEPVFPEEIAIPTGVPDTLIQQMIAENISSFNRLYNYQLNKRNHSFGAQISYDNGISLIKPEISIIYNLTTKDMMIRPLINFKPADNLAIIIGSDIYMGRDKTLYDLIKPSLTSIYTGLKVNF